MTLIKPEDVSEEEVEAFLGSKLFQKFYAYRNLTDGINALKDDETMYDTLVDGIERRQSRVSSRQTVEEFLEALVAEVEDNTGFIEPLEAKKTNSMDEDAEF